MAYIKVNIVNRLHFWITMNSSHVSEPNLRPACMVRALAHGGTGWSCPSNRPQFSQAKHRAKQNPHESGCTQTKIKLR